MGRFRRLASRLPGSEVHYKSHRAERVVAVVVEDGGEHWGAKE